MGAEAPRRKLPKPVDHGPVVLYGGQHKGRLVEEPDPDGSMVLHERRADSYEHDRLFFEGVISSQLRRAGEMFLDLFERAGCGPRYGSGLRSDGPGGTGCKDLDSTAVAREELNRALAAIGRSSSRNLSAAGDVAWHVIGCGDTLPDYVARTAWRGRRVRLSDARAMLLAGLEKLAIHFDLLTVRDVQEETQRRVAVQVCDAVVALARMEAGELKAAGDTAGHKAMQKFIKTLERAFSPTPAQAPSAPAEAAPEAEE